MARNHCPRCAGIGAHDPPEYASTLHGMYKKPATSLQATPKNELQETKISEESYSYRREWLAQAWSDFGEKLAQEKTVSGVAGIGSLLITVVLFFIQSQPWLSLLPVGIFLVILSGYFIYVLFRAPGRIDERKRLAVSDLHKREAELQALSEFSDAKKRRRDFLAERLTSLLHEAGEVEYGAVSLRSIESMGKVWRQTAYHDRAKNFVKQHWGPETASRYDKEKSSLLESLLADLFREKDETKPDISGAVEDVIQKKLLPEQGQGIAGFDYYFTLRFWLRNTGAPCNFQNFSVSIFVDNKSYAGERLPVTGYCLYKQVPTQSGAHTALQVSPERLEEFDAISTLERNNNRHGWLRFVVRNVHWNQRDESSNYISHLDLTVTDGSGGEITLTDKSSSWRHENPPNFEVRNCPPARTQLGP